MLPPEQIPQSVEELIEIILLTYARQHECNREMIPFEIETVVRRAVHAAYRAGKTNQIPAASRFSSATIKALQIPRVPEIKLYRHSKAPIFPLRPKKKGVIEDDE